MYRLFCRAFQLIMKIAAYVLPWREPELIEGSDSILTLPEHIRKRGLTSILLVTDKEISELGLCDGLLEALSKSGIKTTIYDKTVPNPRIDNVKEALQLYKENNCGGIIAFGGGSAMDCAKGVGVKVARPKTKFKRMKGLLKVILPLPPLYAIPTTAGTGSEATVAAVLVDGTTGEKFAIMDPTLIPRVAVLDPQLTIGLPPHITATTGIDALTHAVEAYIGRSNTRHTRKMALEAVKLVFENLHKAYTDGSCLKSRANMLRAAYCGGVAFTRAYVGYAHAIAHTLGGLYGVPHGLANAVILPYVLDDFGESIYKPLSELADAAGISGNTNEIKAKAFIKAIRNLNASMEIPETIPEIKKGDIPLMIRRSMKESNPVYPVPRIFKYDDFQSIFLRLMGKSGIYGFAGKMARIDLASKTVTNFMMQKDDLFKYLGGKGIAAKLIFDELDQKTDAFSDENIIAITTSPLNGSAAPSSSRYNISTISPLTGLLFSSNCGGDFGLKLKGAGYDALVITGKSENQVYIHVTEEGIKLNDATHIWGMKTGEAQEALGKGGKLVIGPAGENLVKFACVINEERAVGRGGVGAVFGYKRLKGVVAEGKATIEMPDREKFKKCNKKWIASLRKHAITGNQLPKLGTAALVRMMQGRKLLATKNYAAGTYQEYVKVSGETLACKHLIKNKGCKACPTQCGRVVKVNEREVKGPELETIGLLGPNLLNDNLERIIRANHLLDEYGMDTMSFGNTIGFCMELSEKGLWDNGLRFGETEDLEELVKMTAYREGVGNEIAEGVRNLSEKYGGEEFAIHVKGLEIAAYEPRAAQGMGLGYATANRGGCHLNGGYLVVLEGLGLRVSGRSTVGKAGLTVFFQDLMEAVSASGICLFSTYAVLPSALVKKPKSLVSRIACAVLPLLGGAVGFIHNHSALLGVNVAGMIPYPFVYMLVTGVHMNIGKYIKAGERIYNLERSVNVRQGMRDADNLPKRLTNEPQDPNDPKSLVRLDTMLKSYYGIRGWDKHGIPKKKRLKKLGLLES